MIHPILTHRASQASLAAFLLCVSQTSCNTTSGAIGGALIGAGAGAAIDDEKRGRGALIGAAAGAATGGFAGNKIEKSNQNDTPANYDPPPGGGDAPANYDPPPPP